MRAFFRVFACQLDFDGLHAAQVLFSYGTKDTSKIFSRESIIVFNDESCANDVGRRSAWESTQK